MSSLIIPENAERALPHAELPPAPPARLKLIDYVLLTMFSITLFGYSGISGRPLSLHEARLPQTSREMMAGGDYLIPRSGGRPWLERPPLPHWITIGVSAALRRHCDSESVVRLPAAMMGCVVVLMCAWMAGVMFGRGFGLVSGLLLATMYEFYQYASLAEDDIFLAALVAAAMAVFARIEFAAPRDQTRTSLLGRRRLSVLAFFALTGLTGLAKGPLVGAMVIAPTAAAYMVLSGKWRRVRTYTWLWGWLVFLIVALAWPALVYHRYPEAMENWRFDYSGTEQYDQPIWYYPVILLLALLPWTPAALLGAWLLLRRIGGGLTKAEKFVLCWAIVPIVILSIPHRKHHHYLVPSLAPWAMIATYGLFHLAPAMFNTPPWSRRVGFGLLVVGVPGAAALLLLHRKIPGQFWVTIALAAVWLICVALWYLGLTLKNARINLASILLGVAIAYSWGQSELPDRTTQDTAFLRAVESNVPHDMPLMIDGDLGGELDFFRNAFYVRPGAVLLHNLSFLRDEKIRDPQVCVITRARDGEVLQRLGSAEQLLQSTQTRRETSPADRFTLFRLTFRPDLARYPAPLPDEISTMQAMGRKPGPYCGPGWDESSFKSAQ